MIWIAMQAKFIVPLDRGLVKAEYLVIPLWKHIYSNILTILQPKKENF